MNSDGLAPLELKIHLNHLQHNFLHFKSLLDSRTKIMAMVKADAYGCGAVAVAKRLEDLGADYLGVAFTQEGIELRKEGVELPVMVMSPSPEEYRSLIEYRLEPEITSLPLLQQWVNFIQKENLSGAGIHLEIDTGMHRLGFLEMEMEALITIMNENQEIQVQSVFSHLASSSQKEHDAYTRMQFSRFEDSYSRLTEALNIRPDRHILNSAGIYRFPDHQYDMVRLGIGLYGAGLEDLVIQQSLKPVQTLQTTIAQIKNVAAGEAVGYSRAEVADTPRRIAVLRTGYADGLPRMAGNRRFSVYIKGAHCPVVGNICMDMTMVDVTGQPEIDPGAPVEIYGLHHPVIHLARAAQTIPYEILTANHARAARSYLG